MTFDYKKAYKEFYLPPAVPGIVEIPPMNFIGVRGKGNPNEENGAYKDSIGLLYGIAFTLKMCKKANYEIEGYFDYVVPPLEGLWWMENQTGINYSQKENFEWISIMRLPDFVSKEDVAWAIQEAGRKKKRDFSEVQWFSIEEGLCVQCLHLGSYDDEPKTIEAMDDFARSQGYALDFSEVRRHHEIYLSDARKVAKERLRTVIRHPIKKR